MTTQTLSSTDRWLRERGWICERVWRMDLRDYRFAVGHTYLGVFNVKGWGRSVEEAVADARGHLWYAARGNVG